MPVVVAKLPCLRNHQEREEINSGPTKHPLTSQKNTLRQNRCSDQHSFLPSCKTPTHQTQRDMATRLLFSMPRNCPIFCHTSSIYLWSPSCLYCHVWKTSSDLILQMVRNLLISKFMTSVQNFELMPVLPLNLKRSWFFYLLPSPECIYTWIIIFSFNPLLGQTNLEAMGQSCTEYF